jgi:hypothetical protein
VTEDARSHAELAAALRERVLESGVLAPALRRGVLDRANGGSVPVDAPYDDLVRQVAGESFRVIDRQVDEAREAAGSERAAFEVVLAASIGAGLSRWDAAFAAIDGASDAPG